MAHEHRAQARHPQGGSSARGARAGWPGGSPRAPASGDRAPRRAPPSARSARATAPGQAPAGAAPIGHRRPAPGPSGSTVTRRTDAPRSTSCHHRADGPLGHALGLVGSAGSSDLHGDRLGRGPLHLAHHQLARCGRWRASARSAGCHPGGRGGRPRGSPMSDRGRSTHVAGPPRPGAGRGRARPAPGRDVQLGRGARADTAASTTAARRARPRRRRASTRSWTPRAARAPAVTRSPRRAPVPARRGPTKTSGPVGSTGRTRRRVLAVTRTSTRRPADGRRRGR